jgi:hypothetical protein
MDFLPGLYKPAYDSYGPLIGKPDATMAWPTHVAAIPHRPSAFRYIADALSASLGSMRQAGVCYTLSLEGGIARTHLILSLSLTT